MLALIWIAFGLSVVYGVASTIEGSDRIAGRYTDGVDYFWFTIGILTKIFISVMLLLIGIFW
jgi:hypothetical protein